MRGVLLALAAAVAVALPIAGCGSRDEPSLTEGKALFVQGCGSCHALNRAGTQGKTGPNLDAAFRTALRDGMTRETVEGVVHHQILYPRKHSAMPAEIYKGKQAGDVAAYVAYVASRPGQDGGALAQAGLAGAKTGEQISPPPAAPVATSFRRRARTETSARASTTSRPRPASWCQASPPRSTCASRSSSRTPSRSRASTRA